ncbi:His Kinase A (phospho-acceptor) domain-containing protein [Lachnospiraceae bacterium C10]|nr:His Kinase A (phospho-acceptor) domain-containing protein [Lachnospiraceae bacterium C10]
MEGFVAKSNLYFELMATLFDVGLCLYLMIQRELKEGKTNRRFRYLAYVMTAATAIDVAATIVTKGELGASHFFIVLMNTLNYAQTTAVVMVFNQYLFSYIKPEKAGKLFWSLNRILLSVYGVAMVLNLFFPVVVGYDMNKKDYINGPLHLALGFGIPVFLFAYSGVIFWKNRTVFNRLQMIAISNAYVVVVVANVLQPFFGIEVMFSYGVMSIGIFVLYFAIETPDYHVMLRLSDELEVERKKAREAALVKSNLLANISHEMRTPLNAVMGFNAMILSSSEETHTRQTADEIRRVGESLLDTINAILDLSKMEAGTGTLTDEQLRKAISFRRSSTREEKTVQPFTAPDARILCVDDTPMNCRVLAGLLQKTGIRVDEAYSGKDALKYLEGHSYDLVFLDHMMPEMDGIETFYKAREIQKTCYVALTGNSGAEDIRLYQSVGFHAYLSKPLQLNPLLSLLREHLPADKVREVQG